MKYYMYKFLQAEHYKHWHPRRRLNIEKASIFGGKNCVSQMVVLDEVSDQPDWLREVSTDDGRNVAPVLLQKCRAHELVWFPDDLPVSQREFHLLLSKCGDLQYTIHSDTKPIHARLGGKVVALLWPCAVPDPDAAIAMRLDIALRSDPPDDVERLKELVVEQLQPMCGEGAAELLWAAERMLNWLKGRGIGCNPCGSSVHGVTEWEKCSRVEFKEPGFVFSRTMVLVPFLFQYLRDGRTVEEFLADFPTVTKDHVFNVLDEVALSLYS